jgi:hypothetical protein
MQVTGEAVITNLDALAEKQNSVSLRPQCIISNQHTKEESLMECTVY